VRLGVGSASLSLSAGSSLERRQCVGGVVSETNGDMSGAMNRVVVGEA